MAINVEELRKMVVAFCQDDPTLNVITRKREFSDPLITLSIRLMVSDFNRIHVTSYFSVKDFPGGTESIQLYGTIYHLLNSATLLQVRNHLTYNDSGLSVGQFAKSGEYSGIADRFKGMFEQAALQVKYDYNISQGYGSMPSEYSYFGGFASFFGH